MPLCWETGPALKLNGNTFVLWKHVCAIIHVALIVTGYFAAYFVLLSFISLILPCFGLATPRLCYGRRKGG